MTDNLKLWNSVEKTPEAHTKKITGKSYQGTSPKPHYLIHKATETFGPCGIGWGFTVEERIEQGALISEGFYEKMSVAKVRVWYKWGDETGEVEHIGGTLFSGQYANGKRFTDEDAPKKSVTDALVKALSMIGFAGDIFMGRYDDSKYMSELREEATPPKPVSASKNDDARNLYTTLETAMRMATTKAELRTWWQNPTNVTARNNLPTTWQDNLREESIKLANELPEGHPDQEAA